MSRPRYFTKSRFKLACECPTKLFYTGKNEYANRSIDDPFLLALADGGFQVGELAKCYFPGGVEVTSLDYDEAFAETTELLKRDSVTIFEAAVRFENLFIRADVLIKNREFLRLIEVKSKSWGGAEDSFFNKNGSFAAKWIPYLTDVAFQKFVVKNAFPASTVTASLMMTDKTALCPTDGLHQKIMVVRDAGGRKRAKLVSDMTDEDLSSRMLCEVPVDDCCDIIFAAADPMSFAERVAYFADHYERDEMIVSPIGSCCKACEFRAAGDELASGIKSGYNECWERSLGWTRDECGEQTVLDVWNLRNKDKFFEDRRIRMSDLAETDVKLEDDGKPGLSTGHRQLLQIQKAAAGNTDVYADTGNLEKEMSKWKFPLHFIDFETATPAIPFNRGRRPYEGMAFQFSHHIVRDDGSVEHAGEYLNTDTGKFPNYDFARALKAELETDEGTIFRYADHENTYLNTIVRQLAADASEVPDRDELTAFMKHISRSKKDSVDKWDGERCMVDMLVLVKRYYYDPAMKGSNSIKFVLPAILNSSRFLQEKYSQPIYGADGGIPSRNFPNWTWVRIENGRVTDPYKLLPKMFQDVSDGDLELLSDDEIRDGGAAMTAYARLQFEAMSEYERGEIIDALRKYCELDTMAMVMIYEGWKDLLNA